MRTALPGTSRDEMKALRLPNQSKPVKVDTATLYPCRWCGQRKATEMDGVCDDCKPIYEQVEKDFEGGEYPMRKAK